MNEYTLSKGVPLNNSIFQSVFDDYDDVDFKITTVDDFVESNTYNLSDVLVDGVTPVPDWGDRGIKLICDVNFLIEVSPFLADKRILETFHYQDGDYILYTGDVWFIRDNVAYSIGGGCGAEPQILSTKDYIAEYDEGACDPHDLPSYKNDYPLVVM